MELGLMELELPGPAGLKQPEPIGEEPLGVGGWEQVDQTGLQLWRYYQVEKQHPTRRN
jgi:hypothetical protein